MEQLIDGFDVNDVTVRLHVELLVFLTVLAQLHKTITTQAIVNPTMMTWNDETRSKEKGEKGEGQQHERRGMWEYFWWYMILTLRGWCCLGRKRQIDWLWFAVH